jgi:hypothetical protein
MKNLGLIWAIQTEIYGPDLNKMKGYFRSNLNLPYMIQWLGSFPSTLARSSRTELQCTICDDTPFAMMFLQPRLGLVMAAGLRGPKHEL